VRARGRASAAATLAVLVAACGGRARLEDRTTAPSIPASAIETVVDLPYPPGNIAVSATGRVFFTLHPDGSPPTQVHELRDGKAVPYPSATFADYRSVLALRIDRQNRLWALDYADYGRGQPRIIAFDLATDREVQRYDFPSDVAGFLSMLNDFQVDPTGRYIFIAEASPIRQTPAIIVYDTVERRSRRLLDSHPSLLPKGYVIQAPGRDMIVLGFYALHIGIDTIALDRKGEWLYYGAVNADRLYRIPAKALVDPSLSAEALARQIEDYGPKTLSDGATTDDAGNVYLTDMEHSAVVTLGPDRTLRTLVKDPKLRWPDGMSFGPDGWLYLTCSSLQHVLFVSSATVREHAPYQIFRFRPGASATPGQ
jgi:sugar lactone lactonase YvrE